MNLRRAAGHTGSDWGENGVVLATPASTRQVLWEGQGRRARHSRRVAKHARVDARYVVLQRWARCAAWFTPIAGRGVNCKRYAILETLMRQGPGAGIPPGDVRLVDTRCLIS